jgi:hypothetical protein
MIHKLLVGNVTPRPGAVKEPINAALKKAWNWLWRCGVVLVLTDRRE